MRNPWHGIWAATAAIYTACGISTAAAAYDFTLIAQTGTLSAIEGHPAIANDGTVAFVATLPGGIKSVWTGIGLAINNIAIDNANRNIAFAAPDINNAGQVGFFADFSGTGGFWLNTGGAPGTFTNLFNSPGFGAIQGQVAINDAGVGAASVQRLGTEGIYASSGSPVQLFSQPVSTGLQNSADINNAGHVAFTNVDANGNRGIFMWNGSSVVQIVDVTTNGAGLQTGSAADIQTPRINDANDVVFHGRLTTGESGIFTETSGTVSQVALAGISGGQYGSFDFSAAINNSDEVAFLASVIGGGDGIFTGGNPTTDKVIRVGDTLFGATVTGLSFGTFGLNDKGQVTFWATLDDGRTVIARANPPGIPEPATLALLGLGLAAVGVARRRLS